MTSVGFGYRNLSEVADPVDNQDAATKAYVLANAGSLSNGAVTPAKLAGVPTLQAGHVLGYDGTNFFDDGPAGDPFMRTNAVASTLWRTQITVATITAVTSGTLDLVAIKLRKGQQFNKVTFLSGTTALATGTHQWFCLFTPALALVDVTNDDTSNAWAANAEKTLTLSLGTYTVPSTGIYVLGCMIAAATVPTKAGLNSFSVETGFSPVISGTDTTHTGLTTPSTAPTTAANVSKAGVPYAYVGN